MPNKRKELKVEASLLWYLVGLITTDGNLSKDGRHVDITLKDREMLLKITKAAGLNNKVGIKMGGLGNVGYRIQISNVNFYNFLISVGLFPNKSLSLGKLAVPDKYFPHFLRGVIDGDGCIRSWIHSLNKREQWSLRIYSGSRTFVNWLKNMIKMNIGACGKIYDNNKNRLGNALYVLKFGKMAARCILARCYNGKWLSLDRKRKLANECTSSRVGWKTSRTVVVMPG